VEIGLRAIAVLAAVLVWSVDGASSAPTSHSYPTFFTPQKQALCKLDSNIAGVTPFTAYLNCWRPRDGFTVTLGPKKRPLFGPLKANKGLESYTLKRWLLPFGATWWGDREGEQGRGRGPQAVQYRCTSRADGLTCRSIFGHGFWLGRVRAHRIF
jgi:hypothetical protein